MQDDHGRLAAGRRRPLRAAVGFFAAMALAAAAAAPASGAEPPMVIARQGSFSVGGKVLGEPGKNSLSCDHGFVEYQIPVKARRYPLFMWHSSSVAVWQNRWDGGEGYQSIFLRKGYPVYLWDGPRVGRANWGCEPQAYEPTLGKDQRNFYAWRFGPAYPDWFPGVQFPIHDAAALESAMRARYDEIDTTANAYLQAEAAAKALDRIGPSVVLTNSAGGFRALLAALKTDNIKAIVAYEDPGFVFPDGFGPPDKDAPYGPTHVPMAEFKKLTKFPIQFVFGDNIDKSAIWTRDFKLCQQFVEILNANGGQAEILLLPSVGLKGNTHIAFADMNNVAVATQLSLFLKRHKLDLQGGP